MPSARPSGARSKGSLKDVRTDDLAAVPLRALVERNPEVDFAETADVMMGCGFGVGEAGHNVGRVATLLAGLDHHVPATTVNRFCASSLQTLRMAFHAIKAGEGDQYIAAGVEAVSRFPQAPPATPHPQLDGSERRAVQRLHPDGADGRERRHALRRLAARRRTSGRSSRRTARSPRATPATSTPRSCRWAMSGATTARAPERRSPSSPSSSPSSTPRRGRSRRATRARSTTARRRSSCISDEKAARLGLKPRARIVASSVAAIRPELMGLGPIPAVRQVLARAGMTISDIDIVELNEAFAAQVIPCRDELGIDPDKLNPFGGSIALGHPFGMTGARIMTTLLNGLDATDGTLGLETMCVAGGMGQAMIVERLN